MHRPFNLEVSLSQFFFIDLKDLTGLGPFSVSYLKDLGGFN